MFLLSLLALIVVVAAATIFVLRLVDVHVWPAIVRRVRVWRGRRAAQREGLDPNRIGGWPPIPRLLPPPPPRPPRRADLERLDLEDRRDRALRAIAESAGLEHRS